MNAQWPPRMESRDTDFSSLPTFRLVSQEDGSYLLLDSETGVRLGRAPPPPPAAWSRTPRSLPAFASSAGFGRGKALPDPQPQPHPHPAAPPACLYPQYPAHGVSGSKQLEKNGKMGQTNGRI